MFVGSTAVSASVSVDSESVEEGELQAARNKRKTTPINNKRKYFCFIFFSFQFWKDNQAMIASNRAAAAQ